MVTTNTDLRLFGLDLRKLGAELARPWQGLLDRPALRWLTPLLPVRLIRADRSEWVLRGELLQPVAECSAKVRAAASRATAVELPEDSVLFRELVLPTLANAALSRAVPVSQGVELMLAQRQTVHGAWDLPREQTMERFFRNHPEWRNTAPLPAGFHWKWYYAFQQLGDESVAPQFAAYREGLQARQAWTGRLGWLLPGVPLYWTVPTYWPESWRSQPAFE